MNEEKIFITQASLPPYEEYMDAIKPLWDSHWITNMGNYHMELEEKLKDYLQVHEISLMVNGHMALELTIQAFEFPTNSEIITTPFTFISTTNAIVRNGLKPVFCDVKLSDGTIDEAKIEKLITDRTVAILPVHVYGNICEVEKIQEIAEKHNLKVIYDAEHAFGVKYKGIGIGNYGDASIFSFHATKIFNTIEGGAVSFKNHELYERLYNLKNFGIRGEELVVNIGSNAKMNEFCAIMGLCNLKHINDVILARQEIVRLYSERINEISGLKILLSDKQYDYNYSYFPIYITDDYICSRDELYLKFRQNGIYTRKYFYPLTSEQMCYKNIFEESDLSIAKDISNRILALPLYDKLNHNQLKRITDIL